MHKSKPACCGFVHEPFELDVRAVDGPRLQALSMNGPD